MPPMAIIASRPFLISASCSLHSTRRSKVSLVAATQCPLRIDAACVHGASNTEHVHDVHGSWQARPATYAVAASYRALSAGL